MTTVTLSVAGRVALLQSLIESTQANSHLWALRVMEAQTHLLENDAFIKQCEAQIEALEKMEN